jgi:hypothetical protein
VEVGAAIHIAAVLPFASMLCRQLNTGEATRFTIDIAQVPDGSIHVPGHVHQVTDPDLICGGHHCLLLPGGMDGNEEDGDVARVCVLLTPVCYQIQSTILRYGG